MNTTSSPFTCKRNDLLIKGMQYLPENYSDKKFPAVIICHGFSGNYSDMEDWGLAFAQIGYAAFCFSFCGGSSQATDAKYLSDGNSIDMTLSSEIDDLLCVKDYVQQLSFVDSDNLILVGGSQGGLVAALTAARCNAEIKKLILFFPALCIPDHARKGRLATASYDPVNPPEYIDCHSLILGKAFHDEAAAMDPYLEIAKYTGPVLILQGLEDDIVNFSYAVRAKETYKKNQCQLQLIRNMGHCFPEHLFQSGFASIRQFLAERKEILSIRVIVTRTESETVDGLFKNNVYFTGYCETEHFQGCISPEGCDVQTHYPDGVQLRAEYTLIGTDSSGETCSLHIVNQWRDNEWRPVIQTNSKVLAWLNSADLTAVLEFCNGGPTVRIFA